MNKIFLCIVAMLIGMLSHAQQTISFLVKDSRTGEPLQGASVINISSGKGGITDTLGLIQFNDLLPGKYQFSFSFAGLAEKKIIVAIPYEGTQPYEIILEDEEDEEEEVVVQSTRSTRTIRDIPTRIEFVAGEELDEKANMKPGDIRMVLSESTGIQTQQTSATSANASIRIQGLDGRYTQVLKDGFPLYAGFSSGLGLLQTPPLDLKQFEVIKGSASTLYGGGAIAGLINLISKTPKEEKELKFHLDATSGGGINTSGFYGQRFGKLGLTLFAARNSNAAYDPADIKLTAIPKFERYTINPRFFVYFNPRTQINIGVNFSTEDRIGGDIDFIKKKKTSGFFEKNNSDRFSTQFKLEHHFGRCSHIELKNSFSYFKRIITLPGYVFNGIQRSSFTEATYASHGEIAEWVVGLNLLSDQFNERQTTPTPLRDYRQLTTGIFVQNSTKLNDWLSLETGIRGDYVKDYGFAFLPRLSALVKISSKLSSRIGGGLGYKAPTVFTEESERLQYRNVLPIDDDNNKLERSYGANADINYKTRLAGGRLTFNINHLFFYTRISDPLLLLAEGNNYRFYNVPAHIDSRGMETNVKLGYHDFKLFLGYTYTDAQLHWGGTKTENFLTPRHRINSVLMYEQEDKWKMGLEAYYFSRQRLSDGKTGRSYWITGFMVEKLWPKFSLYINFENFLDARQTRFDTIYTGTIANPLFRDIYAPLDGFVVNGGVKVRF